jgi:hypothetical protein
MSTSTASARPADASNAFSRLTPRVRTGQTILTLVLILCALVSLSTAFVDDPFEPDAVLLIASFGVLACMLGLASVWGGVRSRLIRISVWALPLFFISHLAVLGTWLPDGVLAVVSAIGAALVAGAGGGQGHRS